MSESPLDHRGGRRAAAADPPSSSTGPEGAQGERHGTAAASKSTPPPTLPSQGDLVGGKYRLRSLIARGGMAAVWLAYNVTLDVPVAVKFIRADLAGGKDPRLADRLLREARSTAKLGHPAIVGVHDFGKTDRGVPYLVMELLEGESLDVALDRRGRVAARKAVRALLPVAHALAASHDKGIVHRDLKPDNIFMAQTAGGRIQPKLIDFGISKVKQSSGKRLTFVGEAMGTPAYMSPEQALGSEVDHRSDIWAFCVVLYELVTGSTPFHGSTIIEMARAIIDEAPQPITAFSAGDEQLWTILEKGLAKSPAERWQSMGELGGELACWLIDRGIHEDISGASLEAAWLADSPPRGVKDAFASLPPPANANGRRTGEEPSEPVREAQDETSRPPADRRRALSLAQTLPSVPGTPAPPAAESPVPTAATDSAPEMDAAVAPEPADSSPGPRQAGAALTLAADSELRGDTQHGVWLAVAAAGLLVALGAILGLLL